MNKNKKIYLIVIIFLSLILIIISFINMISFKNYSVKNYEPVIKKKISKQKTIKYADNIPVLNYHFFYDSSLGEICDEPLCEPVNMFEEQLNYLKENKFKTLTINEFYSWINKKIKLPKKSILITIDDGAMGTSKINGNKLIPLLEKYNMNATLFLVTSWWDKEDYSSKKLDIQSHGYNIHKQGSCGKSFSLCINQDVLLKDLTKSISITGSNLAFAYPYFAYNDNVIETVKKAGFKLAFTGDTGKPTINTDKYKIPRFQITNTVNLEQFKSFVN